MSDRIINLMVDVLNDCSLKYFEATAPERENTGATNYLTETLHSNFYECLLSICNYFLTGEPLEIIADEDLKYINEKLDSLKDLPDNESINQEDVRRALLLLDLKGFRDVNFSYDLITPDTVSCIMNYIVDFLFPNKKELTIIDPNFGVGNLMFYLGIHLNREVDLIGFEQHELLSRVACVKANMIEQDLELHFDDCLSMIPSYADCVVSDLASYDYINDNYSSNLYNSGVRYFPYLVIEHYLNIKSKVSYCYLIDSDFFNHEGSDLFRKMLLEKGNIVSLISLPDDFFVNMENHKSILILNNDVSSINTSVEVYQLPSLKDEDGFKKVLNNIKEHLQSI